MRMVAHQEGKKMNGMINYELERGDEFFDLEIEFTTSRYYPAVTYGPPENCSPAEGGEVEAMQAYCDGKKFEMTEDEWSEVEQYIYDNYDYSEE